jgi:hypothetical protein
MMASTCDVWMGHPDLVPPYLARRGSRIPRAQHVQK